MNFRICIFAICKRGGILLAYITEYGYGKQFFDQMVYLHVDESKIVKYFDAKVEKMKNAQLKLMGNNTSLKNNNKETTLLLFVEKYFTSIL